MLNKYKVAIVTMFALFMDLLDLSIVILAIPTLRAEFAGSMGLAQLAVTIYVLIIAIVMPASGWVADRFGTKRTFMFSLGIFTVGSALCGAAWSMEALILARALQGIGGGLLVPVGLAVLFRAFPDEERATASAIFSVPAAVAPALGPFLGGILIDTIGWRWIFLINVPIGLVGLGLAKLWLAEYRVNTAGSLDTKGLILGGAGLVAVMFALSAAPEGAIMRADVLVPLLVGLLILTVFTRIELTSATPMVDFRLFEERNFALGNAVMFLASIGFGGLLFALPLFLQGPHGVPASQAGTIMAAHAIGTFASTIAAPKLIRLFGAHVVLAAGLFCSGLTTVSLAVSDQSTSLALVVTVVLFAGGAFGLTVVPLQTSGMCQLRITRASSILSVVRQLGVAIGTAAVAVPLGHVGSLGGYTMAFVLSGLVTIIAVPAVVLLKMDGQRFFHNQSGH